VKATNSKTVKKFIHLTKHLFQIIISNISQASILFVLVFALLFGNSFHRWDDDTLIVADAVDYYAYLPAALIYHDLGFGFEKDFAPELAKKKLLKFNSPINKPVIKMSMGVAFCNLPFFALAHLYASNSDEYENNGYSAPYYFMVFIAALFYLWLGLFYLRKLLLFFFSDAAVAVVILLIALATNLLFYVTLEPGMSHVYSFALISMFVYFSFQWLKEPNWKPAAILGLLLGAVTLIRPSNSIIALFPVLVFFLSQDSLKDKWLFIKNNILKILLALVFMLLVILPQLLYWKTFAGQWVYYTYIGEHFYFNNPHIYEGLFSYRKGWLVYTPIMFFSFLGLFFLIRKNWRLVIPIVVFSLLNFYVIYSWWCWWYGGSYGSRPMIDTYVIYAIPLAAFVQYFINKKVWKRIIVGSIFIFFIYFNTFQIRQYTIGLLHYAEMTKEAYWEILFKMQYPENYIDLIQKADHESALKGEDEKLEKK